MRSLSAMVIAAVGAVFLAGSAMAAVAYGISCGTPQANGNIVVVLTASDNTVEYFTVPLSTSDTDVDKATNIAQWVRDHSTKFNGVAYDNVVEFSESGVGPVKNCGCVSTVAEGLDLVLHDVKSSDNMDAIVTLTGTPSSGVAYAGIPGIAVVAPSTSGYSTAVDVLDALDAALGNLGLTGVYVNASDELVIPITSGTEIEWGTTDADLTSGATIE